MDALAADSEGRRERLTETFAKRGKFYDLLALLIEVALTVCGAAFFALCGLTDFFDRNTVVIFFALGFLFTILSLTIFGWNRVGLFQTITDAVTASNEGSRLGAEGRAVRAEAELVLDRKEQELDDARREWNARLVETTADLERKLGTSREQGATLQRLGEMRSRCLVLTRNLLDMAQHFLRLPESERNIDFALQTLLKTVGSGQGQAAFGFDEDVRWTISIYRRVQESNSPEFIRREHVLRWDGDTSPTGRQWHRGESFSGFAWHTGNPLVIPDTSNAPQIFREAANKRETDAEKYKSVASIPVRVGPDQLIWGVVTATSDRVEHFGNEGDSVAAQLHADSMRSLAAFVSLLVAGSTA